MSLINTQGLSKNYGAVKALDSLDLVVEPGEPIALIGPNGAGKTTLLSLLCGFIRPSAGSAQMLGHDAGSSALRGKVTALPQDAHLDPRFSINRQLGLFARLQGFSGSSANEEVQRVLDTVLLSDAGVKKPGELSHGMRKRVSIAQALMGNPELVLLDEPTAGIDPPNVKIIRDLIRTESNNKTFVISSHNLDELEKLCGTVVYLNEGKLVETGPLVATSNDGFLTIRLPSAPEDQFMRECKKLSGVLDVQRQAQGDYLIQHTQGQAVDQALLSMLAKNSWQYRHLIKGRSLEDRLYG